MTQDEFDSLNGRVNALSMTLTAVIKTLPALAAAQAALDLKIEQQTTQQDDEEEGVPRAEARSRDAILDAYANLLSAVAKNG